MKLLMQHRTSISTRLSWGLLGRLSERGAFRMVQRLQTIDDWDTYGLGGRVFYLENIR